MLYVAHGIVQCARNAVTLPVTLPVALSLLRVATGYLLGYLHRTSRGLVSAAVTTLLATRFARRTAPGARNL